MRHFTFEGFLKNMADIDQAILQVIGHLLKQHPHLAAPVARMANVAVQTEKERLIFSKNDAEERFSQIYKTNYWGSAESKSGPGSTVQYTENLRKHLPGLFEKFKIESVLDAPCGDFNWMKLVVAECPLDYTGGDIVRELVETNNEKYRTDRVRFVHLNIIKDPLPQAQLMICRDCLFHFSFADTRLFLENFVKSDIEYLLTTSHLNTQGFVNQDIPMGSFRMIDLFLAPYNFDNQPLARIDDFVHPQPGREMCLWSKAQIEKTLPLFRWG